MIYRFEGNLCHCQGQFWFFANGVICISEGYRFFMIALADEVEVERVVREVRGLLTA